MELEVSVTFSGNVTISTYSKQHTYEVSVEQTLPSVNSNVYALLIFWAREQTEHLLTFGYILS
jgi:hypothetical protein